jgi:hypothetical protein
MTQTGGLVILYAWLIFAALLTILAYLLLRHEQDPLQDLTHPGPDQDDGRDDRDPSKSGSKSLPADYVAHRAGRSGQRAVLAAGRFPVRPLTGSVLARRPRRAAAWPCLPWERAAVGHFVLLQARDHCRTCGCVPPSGGVTGAGRPGSGPVRGLGAAQRDDRHVRRHSGAGHRYLPRLVSSRRGGPAARIRSGRRAVREPGDPVPGRACPARRCAVTASWTGSGPDSLRASAPPGGSPGRPG